jgi:hypothetical protein
MFGSTWRPVQIATWEQSNVRSWPSLCLSEYFTLCFHFWSGDLVIGSMLVIRHPSLRNGFRSKWYECRYSTYCGRDM